MYDSNDSVDGQSERDRSDTVSDIVDLTETETNGSNSPDPSAMAIQREMRYCITFYGLTLNFSNSYMSLNISRDRIRELEDEIKRLKKALTDLTEQARSRIRELQMEIKSLHEQLNEKVNCSLIIIIFFYPVSNSEC